MASFLLIPKQADNSIARFSYFYDSRKALATAVDCNSGQHTSGENRCVSLNRKKDRLDRIFEPF
jgi:hypothetical protein